MSVLEVKAAMDQFISAVAPDMSKHVKMYAVNEQDKIRASRNGRCKIIVVDVATFVKDDPNTVYLPEPDFTTSQSHMKVANANATLRQDGVSPLHVTAWMGDVRLLHFLLQNSGAEINCSTKNGNTPLMEALVTKKGDRSACTTLLLKYGASITQANRVGYTALGLASWLGDNKVLTKMLDRLGPIDNAMYITQSGQTPLMLALSRDNVASAELLIEQGLAGTSATGGWGGSSTGRWLTTTDERQLSALCWAVLSHPQTAAPYIALRMADAHALQKLLKSRLDDLHLTPNNELLFSLLYKETLMLMMLRSPYTWLLNLHVLEHLYSNALWEQPGRTVVTHEAFSKHPQESVLVRQLPWLVAMMMSVVADIPGISLTFLAHPSASTDLVTLMECIADEKQTKCHILSDKPVHFLLLPFLKAPQSAQWIRDELFNNNKILHSLAHPPNSLQSMVHSVAEFLKVVFGAYKFKAASNALGKELIKKHLIKVDSDTIQRRLEKPWKLLEKCSSKSRYVLRGKGLMEEERKADTNKEAETAAAEMAEKVELEKVELEKKQMLGGDESLVLKISKSPSIASKHRKDVSHIHPGILMSQEEAKANGFTHFQDSPFPASAVSHRRRSDSPVKPAGKYDGSAWEDVDATPVYNNLTHTDNLEQNFPPCNKNVHNSGQTNDCSNNNEQNSWQTNPYRKRAGQKYGRHNTYSKSSLQDSEPNNAYHTNIEDNGQNYANKCEKDVKNNNISQDWQMSQKELKDAMNVSNLGPVPPGPPECWLQQNAKNESKGNYKWRNVTADYLAPPSTVHTNKLEKPAQASLDQYAVQRPNLANKEAAWPNTASPNSKIYTSSYDAQNDVLYPTTTNNTKPGGQQFTPNNMQAPGQICAPNNLQNIAQHFASNSLGASGQNSVRYLQPDIPANDQPMSPDTPTDSEQLPEFFPSAYLDREQLLKGLEGYISNHNAHGDTQPRPDFLPSGLEGTYEFDDYRGDVAATHEAKPQEEEPVDYRNSDCMAARDATSNTTSAANDEFFKAGQQFDYVIADPVYVSDEADYVDFVLQGNCLHPGSGGPMNNEADDDHDIDTDAELLKNGQTEGIPAKDEFVDEDDYSDEFQWNWVPRSRRWRDQLKRLVNSKSSEHQRKSDMYFLSFSDESMLIGESSRSKVILAIHNDGTEMAMKRIDKMHLAATAPDPNKQCVEHPYIGSYKDWAEDAQYVYVARELCEYSLAEYTAASEEEKAAAAAGDGATAADVNTQVVAQQLLVALAALHGAGEAHTNLKPQNVLINASGDVSVVDAGLWYADQNTEPADCWVAPEMLQPKQPCYPRASDVFVAGLLCFYALSGGQHPYGGVEDPASQRDNVADGSLKVFRGQLSDALALDLVLTCMLMANASERASADKCLCHAYFWDEEKRFDFLSKFASQPEMKSSLPCAVTTPINSAQKWIGCNNWYDELSKDLRKLADKLHMRGSTSITSLLVFVSEAVKTQHTWPAQLRRRIPSPARYFLRMYPRLLMPVYEICRDSAWRQRGSLRQFFE